MSALGLGFQANYRGLDRGKAVRINMICTEKYAENTVGLYVIEIIQIVESL
jgi:hypothetical protein